MIIILLSFLALCLYGIKTNRVDSQPLELNQSIALRGICAVEIMIGHVGLMTGSRVLYPNRKAGILFVGIFFMLSGYGVAYGVLNKSGYLKNFLARRIWRLLLPVYSAYVIYEVILIAVCKEAEWTAIFDIHMFFGSINWYVWEQMAFYAVFWGLYKICPDKTNILLVVLSVVFVGSAYVAGVENPCYGSTLCFSLGLLYYKYERKATQVIKKQFVLFIIICTVTLVLSMATFFILGDRSILGNPVARNIASVSFCVGVLMLLSKYIVKNRISYFLGKCSYEIFIVHPFVLTLFTKVEFASSLFYSVASIGVSMGSAVALHFIVVWIMNLVERMFYENHINRTGLSL